MVEFAHSPAAGPAHSHGKAANNPAAGKKVARPSKQRKQPAFARAALGPRCGPWVPGPPSDDARRHQCHRGHSARGEPVITSDTS